mmetsp:Transcript_22680/g.27399  ORF Transcript_22680/g.27399 Transcript_22680/m.27399 type:complete len:123 (-) Transcript_22680:386-754(-)
MVQFAEGSGQDSIGSNEGSRRRPSLGSVYGAPGQRRRSRLQGGSKTRVGVEVEDYLSKQNGVKIQRGERRLSIDEKHAKVKDATDQGMVLCPGCHQAMLPSELWKHDKDTNCLLNNLVGGGI